MHELNVAITSVVIMAAAMTLENARTVYADAYRHWREEAKKSWQ